jgi:hypothetical protein
MARETGPPAGRGRPHGMEAAASETSTAAVEAADTHASAVESATGVKAACAGAKTSTARMEATTSAAKAAARMEAATAAMESATAAVETTAAMEAATTAMKASATAAAGLSLYDIDDREACDGPRGDRSDRHGNLSAGYAQHDFLHLQERRSEKRMHRHRTSQDGNTLRHN